jgi:hypothetical protein
MLFDSQHVKVPIQPIQPIPTWASGRARNLQSSHCANQIETSRKRIRVWYARAAAEYHFARRLQDPHSLWEWKLIFIENILALSLNKNFKEFREPSSTRSGGKKIRRDDSPANSLSKGQERRIGPPIPHPSTRTSTRTSILWHNTYPRRREPRSLEPCSTRMLSPQGATQ